MRERGPGWDFRWQDTSSNPNWISTLDAMIASGQIELTLPPGDSYSVYGRGGYTYIGASGSAIPEPASLLLACIAGLGIAIGVKCRGRFDRSGKPGR
ncbi:MAG TPA: PEP-CTERM sorting domain-containing protein [Isosphaeraceae bacterium]|nr:PEP-CTERM sorting domain-containing protein [Isosphaeraceae bacterium]